MNLGIFILTSFFLAGIVTWLYAHFVVRPRNQREESDEGTMAIDHASGGASITSDGEETFIRVEEGSSVRATIDGKRVELTSRPGEGVKELRIPTRRRR